MPALMATAAPPDTATSVTGEMPDGVSAAIQKEVDKWGGNVDKVPASSAETIERGVAGPRPRKKIA